MSSFKSLITAAVFAGYVSPIASAAVVTMTYTPNVVRTQLQGGGMYDVYDFFWTNAGGGEFTNYTVTGSVTSGVFHDPARLQDDRQTNPPAAGQDGTTAGAVDMWANTVWSSAGKIDYGFNSIILPDPGGYRPTGGDFSPFRNFKWDVFDNVQGDDNNLIDDPINPTAAAAPYHVMRILTSVGAVGSVSFLAYDTSQPGVAFSFNSFLPPFPPPNTPPTVDPEPSSTGLVGDIISTTFTASDLEDPMGPFTFSDATLASFVPLIPGHTNPPFNGVVAPDGTFTWNTSGFKIGAYGITVRATDPDGATSSPGGFYVVTLFSPEPSSLMLVALAMLGTFGAIRRRST